MKVPYRLEQAITKLYIAFHDGMLHPECCQSCAVGNILDHTESWKHLSNAHGSLVLNYVGKVHQSFGRRFNGYTPQELLQIEAIFLEGCGYSLPLRHTSQKPVDPTNKEMLFKGLCSTVSYLCKLDGVSNVMDYSKLFEFEGNTPVYALSF